MYYCSMLGPHIQELIDGSTNADLKKVTSKWKQQRYCQHADDVYQAMYEIMKVQQVRLVVYDEAEVFLAK